MGLDGAFSAASAQAAGALGAFNTADALLPIEILSVKQARLNRLDTYNRYRAIYGETPAATFAQISSNPETAALLERLYGQPGNVEFYPGLFAEDRAPNSPLPGLLLIMVGVDAFSQALTNPLLSEHVFNANTFTAWGLDEIDATSRLEDVLARNVANRGSTPIVMTQPSWNFAREP